MHKVIIYLLVIFFIIAILIGVLYFYYEKPTQDKVKIELNKLNIYTFDLDTKEQLATDIKILQDGSFFKDTYTLKDGAVEINVPSNHTYIIYNVNKNTSQFYYTTYAKKELYGFQLPQRVNLNLEQPGNLIITQVGQFSKNSEIYLRVRTDKRYKNVHFCLKWSIDIITVRTNLEFEENIKPKRFMLYDKCFYTRQTLFSNTDEVVIPLEYKQMSSLNDRDYIDVVIYDEDCFNGNCTVEDAEGKDIAAPDTLYHIKMPT